jgi:tetratricopeptide (TPR) repeat protein
MFAAARSALPVLIAVVWLSVATGPAFSGSSGQAVAGAPAPEAAEFLPPGAPFTRDLAPGEAHILRFELGTGEWLEATVQQQGVDVTVALLQPDGTAALEIDSREDPMRGERVLWIGGSSGSHALRVRAKPDRPGGRYTVTLDPPRAATPVDTRRAAAWRELERLVRPRRDTDRALKDRVETQRRAESALSYAQAALALQRALADRAAEASLLDAIGWAYRAQGDRAQALEHLLNAAHLARESANPWAESAFLNDVGELHRTTGDAEKAIEWYMTSPDLRASFVAAEQDKYGLYIDLLMRLHEQEPGAGHDAAALESSERARARVLLDTLVEARADIREGVAPTLLDRERALQKQLAEASARLSRLLSRGGSKEDTGREGRASRRLPAQARDLQPAAPGRAGRVERLPDRPRTREPRRGPGRVDARLHVRGSPARGGEPVAGGRRVDGGTDEALLSGHAEERPAGGQRAPDRTARDVAQPPLVGPLLLGWFRAPGRVELARRVGTTRESSCA